MTLSNRQTSSFPDTRWSLVIRTRDTAQASRALDELCRTYWYPIYAVARRHGKTATDAEDLTQGFFLMLTSRNVFPQAEQSAGTLRSYLLKAFRNFCISEWKKDSRRAGGGKLDFAIDWDSAMIRYGKDELASLSHDPDRMYLRNWALVLLERAMQKLDAEMESDTKRELFVLIRPLLEDDRKQRQENAAAAAGMSYAAFRTALHRIRRRYGEIVRREVAETLENPTEEDIDDELRMLRSALER